MLFVMLFPSLEPLLLLLLWALALVLVLMLNLFWILVLQLLERLDVPSFFPVMVLFRWFMVADIDISIDLFVSRCDLL